MGVAEGVLVEELSRAPRPRSAWSTWRQRPQATSDTQGVGLPQRDLAGGAAAAGLVVRRGFGFGGPADRIRKRPVEPGQYTSWAFGTRLRAAGLLGSMRSIGDAYDNSMAESFFHTLQLELLDEHHWTTRRQLASAIFEWIECWYNPTRRHSSIGILSPISYEAAHAPAATAA